jgi:branched-chain amino acid transport system ATP-binding protein
MFEVKNAVKYFGGIHAIDNVSFHLKPNKITSLIGPNGAGKTTMFNLITGYYPPDSGSILIHGRDITGLSPATIAGHGIVRTFQDLRLFLGMSVLDNIMVSGANEKGESFWRVIASPRVVREQSERKRARAMELLDWAGL